MGDVLVNDLILVGVVARRPVGHVGSLPLPAVGGGVVGHEGVGVVPAGEGRALD